MHFETRTVGALLNWSGTQSVRVLFSTEPCSYDKHSAGVFGIGSMGCLLVGDEKVTLLTAHSSHVWNAKERSHVYKLSFASIGDGNDRRIAGTLSYSYIDDDHKSDTVQWEEDKDQPNGDSPTSCTVLNFIRDQSISLVGKIACTFTVQLPFDRS